MLPGGQHATRIMPSAIDGVTGRMSVRANVTAGRMTSWARIAITKGLGLRATTRKSAGEVSRAMPNMMSPSTTFRMTRVPGVKFRTTSSMFTCGLASARASGCRGRAHPAGPQRVRRDVHRAPVGVLVDVVRHALESEVVVAAGEIGPRLVGHPTPELRRELGGALERREVFRDQLGLLVSALPADAGGLDHAHHVQPVERRRKDVEVQARAEPAPVQVSTGDERVVERVPGRQQHRVVLAARSVAEVHGAPVEAIDVGADREVALAEVIQDERVDDRVRFVQLVVGPGEAEAHRIAGERLQDPLVDELLDAARAGACPG